MDRDSISFELLGVLLRLPPPWKVVGFHHDPEREHIEIEVTFERGSVFRCTGCGATDQPVHDTKLRVWEHHRLFENRCFILGRIPRTRCGDCGSRCMGEVPWARPRSGLTRSFEALHLAFCKDMAAKTVADHFGLGDDRVRRTVSHYVNAAIELEDYGEVTSVGIDETSAAKGHTYVTLATDFDRGRVIHASAGRDRAAVGRFATHLRSHGGDPLAVRKACIDMSPAFISGVAEYFPNARVIFDKFHIMKLANEALDAVRREEHGERMKATGGRSALKHKRFILRMGREKLTAEQIREVDSLSRQGLKTGRAYRMKEALRELLGSRGLDGEEARYGLRRWRGWAQRSRLEEFVKLGRMTKKHEEGIVAIFEHQGVTNGPMEAINGKVQQAKGRARGYRNIDNYITVIFLIAGDLTHLPVSPWKTIPYRGRIR